MIATVESVVGYLPGRRVEKKQRGANSSMLGRLVWAGLDNPQVPLQHKTLLFSVKEIVIDGVWSLILEEISHRN
jgi:hypothetical protein